MALLSEAIERLKLALRGRSGAYCRVFNRESLDAEVVLKDLARFCRAHESTANADPHIAARLDGRREVWLRIAQHTKLSDDDQWKLFSGRIPEGN